MVKKKKNSFELFTGLFFLFKNALHFSMSKFYETA